MRIAVLSLGLALLALPAAAQEVECHSSDSYRVAVKPYSEEPGAQIAVTALEPGTTSACRFDADEADDVIGEPGDPLWFYALEGNILVLSRSTGPQGDVVVHDLDEGTVLLDAPSDAFEVRNGKLVFWERTAEGDPDTCPGFAEFQANGFGTVITVEKTLDFADGSVAASGASRCDGTQ